MFGTDVSDKTINAARKGIYSESAVMNVSPERLRRFFARTDAGYQVSRNIREMCIFSRHDVAKDPPLSRMDVISCRNLLIYFSTALQRRVVGKFSYALLPSGCLILGPSETLGSFTEHFSALDEPRKLYCRRATVAPHPIDFAEPRDVSPAPAIPPAAPSWRSTPPGRATSEIRRSNRPVALWAGGHGRRRGAADQELPGRCHGVSSLRGKPLDVDLMSGVRPDLRAVLSTTIEQAKRTGAVVVGESPAKNGG